MAGHALSSRHIRAISQTDSEPCDMQILEFSQAIAPILEQYENLRRQPISWCTAESSKLSNPSHDMWVALWTIVERHAPGLLAYPQATIAEADMVHGSRTSCAMCCADMQGTNGTCDLCSTVLYEVSMYQDIEDFVPAPPYPVENNMYQSHHTLGGMAPLACKPPVESVLSTPPTATDEASIPSALRPFVGSAGAVYQRRAQFRMALASYQGRATRSVPCSIIESVRQHIETIASHLVDTSYDEGDPVERYARVTRVHVMCILRGTGSSKYSKWYREIHYLHFMITKQMPPHLTDSKNMLVLMIDIGTFSAPEIFFVGTKQCKEKKHRTTYGRP